MSYRLMVIDGRRTPSILDPVPYETYKHHPFCYMNLYTILLPDGKMARGRPYEVESGHESAGCVTA